MNITIITIFCFIFINSADSYKKSPLASMIGHFLYCEDKCEIIKTINIVNDECTSKLKEFVVSFVKEKKIIWYIR